MNSLKSKHPKGTSAKILLTSVFGPYAQDDEYGSRKVNPMELYHNQVTRKQGAFSLRMFHRSFGLMMIKDNIDSPCYLLDFPDKERFISEIKNNTYDIIGISGIIPNWAKVKKMCELIRRYQPEADIVIGGHVVNMTNIETIVDGDFFVKGEGVRWFQQYLGQDDTKQVKHPAVLSSFGTRIFGLTPKDVRGETAGILIPSAGCPLGCNFCSTSAHFGGKGKYVNFYETGDILYTVIDDLCKKLSIRSFFILDENFLLYKKRSLRLLELMKQNNKSWVFFVFSSAQVLNSYNVEDLVSLGISWVWLGLEGKDSQYKKLNGIDIAKLIKKLKDHGICVLGSTIIGLENHSPENIDEAIDYAVNFNTDFHQFMLYTPLPGTPFYDEQLKKGIMLPEEECPAADVHGQTRFNYKHDHIPPGKEGGYLDEAFQRDFIKNGPSFLRMMRTKFEGWLRYKNHPDFRIRDRYRWEVKDLSITYAGVIWALKKWYKGDQHVEDIVDEFLSRVYKEYGIKTRMLAPIIGSFVYISICLENRRLAKGWVYEPCMIYEKNAKAIEIEKREHTFSPETPENFMSSMNKFFKNLANKFNSKRTYGYYNDPLSVNNNLIPVDLTSGSKSLDIKLRQFADSQNDVIVDIEGVFDKLAAIKLKEKIQTLLKENCGKLAINFSGVTNIENEALLKFFKILTEDKERIKILSLNSIGEEIAEAMNYGNAYFELLKDENLLYKSA